MNRLLDLESKIRGTYDTLSDYEKKMGFTDRPEEIARSKFMIDKYRDILQIYVKLYYRISTKLNIEIPEDILQIAADVTPELVEPSKNKKSLESKPELHTTLPGSKIIKVVVSQMFRMVDFLTSPETVRATEFYKTVTDVKKFRRTINNAKAIKLKNFGSLSPVVKTTELYDQFWIKALPSNFKLVPNQLLTFFPFEVKPFDKVELLKWIPESVLEATLLEEIVDLHKIIQNMQVSGRLRLYPPGTGVVRLAITLEFKNAVHLEVAAQIARNIEGTLFVDPNGYEKECKTVLFEIVDQVIESIFAREGLDYQERRWLPPTTAYCLYDTDEIKLDQAVDELSYLMALAPGNHEEIIYLKNRVVRAFRSPHWQRDQTLAVVGQQVALFAIAQTFAKGKKNKRQELMNDFLETQELICAAAYAQLAFAEEIENIITKRLLDEVFINDNHEEILKYLSNLLETMYQVLQASTSIKFHLQRHGVGILMTFAKDLWAYNNTINERSVQAGLNYIFEYLDKRGVIEKNPLVSHLQSTIQSIKKLPKLFYIDIDSNLMAVPDTLQEQLESKLLEELLSVEHVLYSSSTEEAEKVEYGLRKLSRTRRQLKI